MFTPILGQELERREHHRRHWWVVLGLVAVLAGEETSTSGLISAAGPAIGFAQAQMSPEPLALRRGTRTDPKVTSLGQTQPSVTNLYWRHLERARATAMRQIAARQRWRFDADLRTYLAGFLRAPTVGLPPI